MRNNQPWIEVVNKSPRKQSRHGGHSQDTTKNNDLQQNPRHNEVHTVQSIQKIPRYTEVHCEGVLNNTPSSTGTHSHRLISSVPRVPHSMTPYPRAQASNDTSPCLQARLIVRPSTGRYWPKRLVQRPIHIRQ
jgi:hypothetical protein